jgi:hypothetical protein
MHVPKAAIACFLLGLLTACAGSSYQKVPYPAQDVPVSRPDLSRIYLLRESSVRGVLQSIRVLDGDTEIGEIKSDDYLCWERPAGRSLVKLYYQGSSVWMGETEGLLDLRTEPGKRYVYSIGLTYPERKPETKLLSDKEAQEILASRSPAPAR